MKIVSENRFSGKTYFYTIASRRAHRRPQEGADLRDGRRQGQAGLHEGDTAPAGRFLHWRDCLVLERERERRNGGERERDKERQRERKRLRERERGDIEEREGKRVRERRNGGERLRERERKNGGEI